MPLPEDLGSSLMDGVVLCHLVNHIRPRSVNSIHVPSPAVVCTGACLTLGKGSAVGHRGDLLTKLFVCVCVLCVVCVCVHTSAQAEYGEVSEERGELPRCLQEVGRPRGE